MRESSVCWMYTSPFRLSGVTVVPFNDIFPARNSTRYLVEDPREPGTRLGNRAPEVVILKKQSKARRAASRAQCPTQTLASPAAPRESERARPSQPGGVRGTERNPAGSPLPRRHCPPARRPRRVRPGCLGHRRPGPGCLGPALLPRPVLPPPGRVQTRALPPRRRWAPTWLCSHSAFGAPSGIALPSRRLPGLAGSPRSARPAAD